MSWTVWEGLEGSGRVLEGFGVSGGFGRVLEGFVGSGGYHRVQEGMGLSSRV